MVKTLTEKRPFGQTGFEVSIIGFGTAELGAFTPDQSEGEKILNEVLDHGVNLIDTADCYSNAEEIIGKTIAYRRKDYILVTKGGHNVSQSGGGEDWTGQALQFGIERSLRRMKTDYVDVLFLHSCSAKYLQRDDLIDSLVNCRKKGLTQFIGYSGDAEDAQAALEMNVFDCLETSVNICDQQAIDLYLPLADQEGLGIIAKRPLANSSWKDPASMDPFYIEYAKPYRQRLQQMNFTPESLDFDGSWVELAIRFSAWTPGVDCAIVGGRNLDHILEDIELAAKGPLPRNVEQAIRETWKRHDDGSWKGQP
ncbi:MAG: aldo/keto reductase [Phycisphaerae bacterium]|jgi:aryl-alcohol dehydrogenase-like predicted oxidoreductase|nr:aldo/keto reductase [Phycisphaerae bacterium]